MKKEVYGQMSLERGKITEIDKGVLKGQMGTLMEVYYTSRPRKVKIELEKDTFVTLPMENVSQKGI